MNNTKYLYGLKYSQIVEAYKAHIIELQLGNPGLKPYLVTTVFADFESNASNPFKAKTEYVWKQYRHVYGHLISQLTKNFTRKTHLHPLTFDFIDLPGTRHHRKLNLYEPTTPHVHSIYLVSEETNDRFQELRNSGFRTVVEHESKLTGRRTLDKLISIHAHAISPGTIQRVVEYSAKAFENYAIAALAENCDLFNQFPLASFERKGGQIKGATKVQRAPDDSFSHKVAGVSRGATTMRSFRCSNELADSLDRFASAENRSSSDVIRDALRLLIR